MTVLDVFSLIPDREQIDFGAGKVLEFRHQKELTAQEYAEYIRLLGVVDELNLRLETPNGHKREDTIIELDGYLNSALQAIIVDLPDEYLTPLGYGIKAGIMRYWMEKSQPEQTPPKNTRRGKRK